MVLFDLFVYVYVLLHFFNSSLKKKRRASLGPLFISTLMTNKRSSSHRGPLGPTDGLNVTRRSPRRLRMAPNLRRPLRTNSALCVFDAKSLKIITPTQNNQYCIQKKIRLFTDAIFLYSYIINRKKIIPIKHKKQAVST